MVKRHKLFAYQPYGNISKKIFLPLFALPNKAECSDEVLAVIPSYTNCISTTILASMSREKFFISAYLSWKDSLVTLWNSALSNGVITSNRLHLDLGRSTDQRMRFNRASESYLYQKRLLDMLFAQSSTTTSFHKRLLQEWSSGWSEHQDKNHHR